MNIALNDPRISFLSGGSSEWWDPQDGKVRAFTLFVPFGCPDWGETKGIRNNLCTFCSLPNAVADFKRVFYETSQIPERDYVELFRTTKRAVDIKFHTLMIFNAGSFLAMPLRVQEEIMGEISNLPAIRRVVIESRAELITKESVARIVSLLNTRQRLTIRIGVETKNDTLRLKVLRKGHSRQRLKRACIIMKDYGVTSGGYVLLNPAPGLGPLQALQECQDTLEWVLDDLKMDEAYFAATCVGPDSELARAWKEGRFKPATLWMVFKILQSARKYRNRVHLLRFKDTPELLAVPSNHIPQGIPENLVGAQGCDLLCHGILDQYRNTMDHSVLTPPDCECRPDWF